MIRGLICCCSRVVVLSLCAGNLHRVFVCEQKNDLPHPIAVITQRDVMRMLLIFLGETLQVRAAETASSSALPSAIARHPLTLGLSLLFVCSLLCLFECRAKCASAWPKRHTERQPEQARNETARGDHSRLRSLSFSSSSRGRALICCTTLADERPPQPNIHIANHSRAPRTQHRTLAGPGPRRRRTPLHARDSATRAATDHAATTVAAARSS